MERLKKALFILSIFIISKAVFVYSDTGFNSPAVTVSEVDGNPKRRPIQEMVFSNGTVTIAGTKATIVNTGGGGGGYAVQPATVTFQLNKGFTASTGTITTSISIATTTISSMTVTNSGLFKKRLVLTRSGFLVGPGGSVPTDIDNGLGLDAYMGLTYKRASGGNAAYTFLNESGSERGSFTMTSADNGSLYAGNSLTMWSVGAVRTYSLYQDASLETVNDGNIYIKPKGVTFETYSNPGVTISTNVSITTAGSRFIVGKSTDTGIIRWMSVTGSLNYGATAAGTCEELAIPTGGGAVTGDSVFLGVPGGLANADTTSSFTAYISSTTSNVQVRRCCNSLVTACANPAAFTVRADVLKH